MKATQKKVLIAAVVLLLLAGLFGGGGSPYLGEWKASSGDGFPTLDIKKATMSGYVLVGVDRGRKLSLQTRDYYTGQCNSPSGDAKSGWRVTGRLSGPDRYEHDVVVEMDGAGEQVTLRFMNGLYTLKKK